MPDITRVFRALHFPRRRREVVSSTNLTPTNVQPGELLYDETANKLYAGRADATAVQVGGGNVVTAATVSAFPATGATGVIYLATDTSRTYQWQGAYMEVGGGPLQGSTDSVTEGATNLYYTNTRAAAAAPVQSVAGRTGTITISSSDVSGLVSIATSGSASDLSAGTVPTTRLPIATDTTAGAIKVGTGLAIANGVLSSAGDLTLRALFTPPAPTGLTVTRGNASATLSWSAPTVLAQTPITDYTEQYSTNNGATWTTFTQAASTATSATITGLTNGTSYVFRVAAVNGVGTGDYTAASNAIRPGVASAPTGLTANPGNTQIALAWTAPSNTGASSITGYTVEYTPSGGAAQTVSTGSASTSYTLTGLINGTAYTVRVAAVTAVGTGDYTAASSSVTPNSAVATGGTVTTSGGFKWHTFNSGGTLTISAGDLSNVEVLVVGSGGGGSQVFAGGGGGGGGVLYQLNQTIPVGTYAVTVAPQAPVRTSGTSSSIGSLYVATGGRSGSSDTSGYAADGGASGFPTTTSNSAGNSGGGAYRNWDERVGGGGGGGAGGAGQAGQTGSCAVGGNGLTVFGVLYGRGGNGTTNNGDQNSANFGCSAVENGPANSGQGGSGGNAIYLNTGRIGTGGSGVVIIRYPAT
jgi:hypothetical protein